MKGRIYFIQLSEKMESPHIVSVLTGDYGFESFLGLNGPPSRTLFHKVVMRSKIQWPRTSLANYKALYKYWGFHSHLT